MKGQVRCGDDLWNEQCEKSNEAKVNNLPTRCRAFQTKDLDEWHREQRATATDNQNEETH
jgi:hypothetical protein